MERLRTFLKIYTWVVLGLIIICIGSACWCFINDMPYRAYFGLFMVILLGLVYAVTRSFVKRNLPKQ